MSREIEPDYETQYLFPRSPEDWVGPDHPARYIREFVDALDLDQIGLSDEQKARREDTTGRPHYGVRLLLKVWLYGYMYRIRSSRALEAGCRDLLPLVWLSGMHQPDHNTLWRFWNRYRVTIRHLFLQSVRVAMRENLIGMVLQAVDGTKIKSAASKRTAWHEDDLKELLVKVEEEIDALERDIAATDEDGGGPGDGLPKDLQKREALRARIKNALEALSEADRKRMQPHDRDARMMVTQGRTEFGYNAQAMVDQNIGMIVAADVTDQENDEHQLVPMVEQVRQNLGGYAETTVADSGYHTAEGLAGAEALGADVLVAVKQKDRQIGPYHTVHFSHDEQADTVTCPEGKVLARMGTRSHKDKPYPVKTYRCRVFSTCPVAALCSSDPKGRVIEISPHHQVVNRNRHHPNARALLKQRQQIVERIFAEIKETLGIRRWSFKGLPKVKSQWLLICAAMNLRRMVAARA